MMTQQANDAAVRAKAAAIARAVVDGAIAESQARFHAPYAVSLHRTIKSVCDKNVERLQAMPAEAFLQPATK